LLDDKAVAYEVVEVDLASGETQKLAVAEVEKLTGKRAFPVILIGQTVIQGYKEEEIERALKGEA
jgi:glutaredoxin-like protein NrdH